MKRWYAVYTQSRMELWARGNLWERDVEAYLPRYHKRRRHARRSDWIAAPLFPRYLFGLPRRCSRATCSCTRT